ncbi:MAG: J domain-containing protein [Alphaproteobacteria bacterium]
MLPPRLRPTAAEDGAPADAPRVCDHPGCQDEGLYRAPRSPDMLDSHYWFCLEHVRSYNAHWDFFAGMNQDEIEAFREADVTGHRPTWPVGVRARLLRLWDGEGLRDLFGLFGRESAESGDSSQAMPACERDALAMLNLGYAATLADIKTRFKELAKRYHPDVNGGDKASEERLKAIIEAYRLLIQRRSA